MNTRRRILPEGWYPGSETQVKRTLASWTPEDGPRRGVSCIVPHAGWFFSGKLAYRTIWRLRPDADTVIVVGGHLPSSGNMLAAEEEGYETPLGIIRADLALRAELEKEMPLDSDDDPDNTVEVVLPMVACAFPNARALWLRAPQSMVAAGAGRVIREAAEKTGRRVVVIGSSDLTHYGIGYGFTPRGTGAEALSWARDENDAGIIDAFLNMDDEKILYYAVQRKAACSAGGALAAAAFARGEGLEKGTLVGYLNSADVHESDSFVGYAGVVYE